MGFAPPGTGVKQMRLEPGDDGLRRPWSQFGVIDRALHPTDAVATARRRPPCTTQPLTLITVSRV